MAECEAKLLKAAPPRLERSRWNFLDSAVIPQPAFLENPPGCFVDAMHELAVKQKRHRRAHHRNQVDCLLGNQIPASTVQKIFATRKLSFLPVNRFMEPFDQPLPLLKSIKGGDLEDVEHHCLTGRVVQFIAVTMTDPRDRSERSNQLGWHVKQRTTKSTGCRFNNCKSFSPGRKH